MFCDELALMINMWVLLKIIDRKIQFINSCFLKKKKRQNLTDALVSSNLAKYIYQP